MLEAEEFWDKTNKTHLDNGALDWLIKNLMLKELI